MDQHPIQGGIEILPVASCYRNRDKLQPDGPLSPNADFTFHLYQPEERLWNCFALHFSKLYFHQIGCTFYVRVHPFFNHFSSTSRRMSLNNVAQKPCQTAFFQTRCSKSSVSLTIYYHVILKDYASTSIWIEREISVGWRRIVATYMPVSLYRSYCFAIDRTTLPDMLLILWDWKI